MSCDHGSVTYLIGPQYTYLNDKEVQPFWPDPFSHVHEGGWARDWVAPIKVCSIVFHYCICLHFAANSRLRAYIATMRTHETFTEHRISRSNVFQDVMKLFSSQEMKLWPDLGKPSVWNFSEIEFDAWLISSTIELTRIQVLGRSCAWLWRYSALFAIAPHPQ